MNNYNLTQADLLRRNQACDWMTERIEDYPHAQQIAQDASTKFDIQVEHLIEFARQLFAPAKTTTNAQPSIDEMVAAVKAHAKENYERDGWDVIVECYDTKDIVKAIDNAKSIAGAIRNVRSIAKVHASRRADVEGEVF